MKILDDNVKSRREIDLHFGMKLVVKGSLDKIQHVSELEIHRNPVARNVLTVFQLSRPSVKVCFCICLLTGFGSARCVYVKV